MVQTTIRPVTKDDVESISALKSKYFHKVYKGFIEPQLLKRLGPEDFSQDLSRFLDVQEHKGIIAESAGRPVAYILFQPDDTDSTAGLIFDVATSEHHDSEHKRLMMQDCISALRNMGKSKVHVIVMKDNFRVRFFFESLGFHATGIHEVKSFFGEEQLMSRYTYDIP